MKEQFIHVEELIGYMGEENYTAFLKYIRQKNCLSPTQHIWIKAEWEEEQKG